MKIHYAVQVCDIANREINNRICGNDRTLLSKKSIKSLLLSIEHCLTKLPETIHIIQIFNDRSSNELIEFINSCIKQFSSDKIIINIENTKEPGILNSIKSCYRWMQLNGEDFVYQVQDDYLFTKESIFEMLELQSILKNEINDYVIISPWNDSWLWKGPYRNRPTPRTVICSPHRYWIQYYDTSCSFFLHYSEFTKHWDLYHDFFVLLDDLISNINKDNTLENKSLNYMLTRRGILGLVPINSLAFHLQSELDEDPHLDWLSLWNDIKI